MDYYRTPSVIWSGSWLARTAELPLPPSTAAQSNVAMAALLHRATAPPSTAAQSNSTELLLIDGMENGIKTYVCMLCILVRVAAVTHPSSALQCC
jgi:hypothetical protein